MRGTYLPRKIPSELDLDDSLRPADAFTHPQDVVCDPDLTVNEKRAILASWASDASAITSCCHSACNIDPLSRGIGVQN